MQVQGGEAGQEIGGGKMFLTEAGLVGSLSVGSPVCLRKAIKKKFGQREALKNKWSKFGYNGSL